MVIFYVGYRPTQLPISTFLKIKPSMTQGFCFIEFNSEEEAYYPSKSYADEATWKIHKDSLNLTNPIIPEMDV